MNKKNNEIKNKNLNCFGMPINDIATNFLIIILAISILFLISKTMISYGNKVNESANSSIKISERVAEIRDTKNTNISNRDGEIFYVSASGDDNNDGLSPESAWKTIDKVNLSFAQNVINNKDTVLFNRGDKFRGNIIINSHEILIGSFGDENLSKPEIIVSPYDGAKEGEWIEVDDNIWKYTVNGNNPFTSDVGAIWFYSNDKVLSNKMENTEGSFEYAQKITTNINVDDASLDLKTILDSDLEFYHVGHASVRSRTGKELYLYSEENPSNRFDRIEFSIGEHGIYIGQFNNTKIDNITIKYAGIHGISAGTVANLKVTNSELGFIGGSTHSYSEKDGNPVRLGNAVEIYGAVTSQDGYMVEDGFVVQNNYVYQVYDAGLTFQYTTEKESKVENVIFNNNVIEYCNYSVEYWNKSLSNNSEIQKNTYINNYEITNNIMRYAGFGISQTRPDKQQSAHIKTWENYSTNDNRVIGKYIISNNIFDTSNEQVFWIYAGKSEFLPEVINNIFYNSYNVKLGYYYEFQKIFSIPYIKNNMEQILPNNTFYYLENDLDSYSNKGISGDVKWEFDNSTGTLYINGSGKMKDYSDKVLPEWYKSRMFIKKIIIGENVSHIGKYAFYDLPYVEELEINCKKLDDFSTSGINIGDNYSFYKTGSEWFGMNVTFGEEVTVIPAYIFWPGSMDYENPKIKNLEFKGNKIKAIKNHAFVNLRVPVVVIPEGVETIESLAFANTSYTKAISIPDTVGRVDSWAFGGNTGLEKIVFGKNVKQINEYMLSGSHSLKEVIFTSDIEFNSNNYDGLFSNISENTIIYGNDSVKKLVSDYCENTNTSNIKYQSIDEYKININLNNDLLELKHNEYKTGDNLEFNLKEGYKIKNINIYQKYQDLDGTSYMINKIILSNVDNIKISTSYWDINILANISKIENNKEDDTSNEDDDVDKPIYEEPDIKNDKEDDNPNEDDDVDKPIYEEPDIKNDKEDDIPNEDDDVDKPIYEEPDIKNDKKDDIPKEDDDVDKPIIYKDLDIKNDKKDDTSNEEKEENKEDKKDSNIKENSASNNYVSNKNNNTWIIICLIIILGVIVCSIYYRIKNKRK